MSTYFNHVKFGNGLTVTDEGSNVIRVDAGAAGLGGALTLITDTTLALAAATIDFSSIAATYKHLRLVLYGRGDTANSFTLPLVRFNNDSGANYDWQGLRGNNATPIANGAFGDTSIQFTAIPAATVTAGVASMAVMDIAAYAATTLQKTALMIGGDKEGSAVSALNVYARSGWWRSTAAINQITILLSAGNFVAGTQASLYGVS